MTPVPTLQIELWTQDAIVLFDWLSSTDLDTVPAKHVAVKQALADLLNQLEQSEVALATVVQIDAAKNDVSKNMGW